MNEIDKALAEWSNINHVISKVAESKHLMTPAEYRALLDKCYARKRAVQARLGAIQRLRKDDLRFVVKGAHYES